MSKDFKDYTVMYESVQSKLISCDEDDLRILKSYKKIKWLIATLCFGVFVSTIFLFTIAEYLVLGSFTWSFDSVLVYCSLVLFDAIICFSFYMVYTKNLETSLKQKITTYVCNQFEDLHWSKTSSYTKEFFYESRVIPWFEPLEYKDIFSGTYKNMSFDIISSKPTKSELHSSYDGVLVVVNMEKDFPSHVVVSDCYSSDGPYGYLHEIGFEDHKFNEKFRVFTDNETKTRSFMDQSFRDKLQDVTLPFLHQKITYTMYQNKFVISVNHASRCFSYLAQPGVKSYDPNSYLKLYTDIVALLSLIDNFKLDEINLQVQDSSKDQVA